MLRQADKVRESYVREVTAAVKQATTRVTTPRSPEEVYAYLVDFDNQAERRFDGARLRAHGRACTGQVGARYRAAGQAGPQGGRQRRRADRGRAAAPGVAFRTLDGPSPGSRIAEGDHRIDARRHTRRAG